MMFGIPDFEWREFGTCYRVSNYGTVQSKATGKWVTKKLKKSKTDYRGGFYMTFCVSGGRHIRLHRFMWETFKGPIPKGLVIDHLDGDRENCAIWNLEAKTQKKNIENLIQRGNFKGFRKKEAA